MPDATTSPAATTPDPSILLEHPLPIARAYLKLWNGVAAEKERRGYDLWELLTRYFATTAVAWVVDRGAVDPDLAVALRALVKPHAGNWVGIVGKALAALRRRAAKDADPAADATVEKGGGDKAGEKPGEKTGDKTDKKARQKESLGRAADLDAVWRSRQKSLAALVPWLRGLQRSLGDAETAAESASLAEAATIAVEFRNKVLAHGAERPIGKSVEMGRLFEAALFELLSSLAFLKTHRLVYVDAIERSARGEHVHRLYALNGVSAYRLPDLVTPRELPVLRGRVYLRTELEPERFVDLLGLLHFDPDDGDVYGLNGIADLEAGTVEYLSYTTGRRLVSRELTDNLRLLLGLALHERVGSEELARMLGEAAAGAGPGAADALAGSGPAPAPVAAAGETAAASLPGANLGRYAIVGKLGAGAFGIVYEAWDRQLKRRVALKVTQELPGSQATRTALDRFRQEAALAADLEHPSIVRIYEAGEIEGRAYYAMEYVEGETLRDWIEARRAERAPDEAAAGTAAPPGLSRSEWRRVLGWGEQAARALHHAHTHRRPGEEKVRPIIHRDVKPENLMIARDGTVKVVDFGLARDVEGSLVLSRSSEIVGTSMYMSPEQATASHDVGPAADVYSLGMTLYVALTLREPFEGRDAVAIRQQVVTRDPRPPRQVAPRLPRDVETIVLAATEKDPARRYATAEDLAEDIRRFLADEPIRARPPGPVERALKLVRRHRVTFAAAAAVLLALGLGLGLAVRERVSAAREVRERRAAHAAEGERLARAADARWLEAIEAFRRAARPADERRADLLRGGDLRAVYKAPDDEEGRRRFAAERERRATALADAERLERLALADAERAKASYAAAGDAEGARRVTGLALLRSAETAFLAERPGAHGYLEGARAIAGDSEEVRRVGGLVRPTAALRLDMAGAWRPVFRPGEVADFVARYRAGDRIAWQVEGRADPVVVTLGEGGDLGARLEAAPGSGQPAIAAVAAGGPAAAAGLAPGDRVRALSGTVATVHAVDPDTLETVEAAPVVDGRPLPCALADLAPGEYIVRIRDPGATPAAPRGTGGRRDRGHPLQFPVLLGPGERAVADIDVTFEEIPEGMAYVPPGPFVSGSRGFFANERPVVEVDLPGFFIDRTEVTNEEFARFVQATGHVTFAEKTGKGGDVPGLSGGFMGKVLELVPGATWRDPGADGRRAPDFDRHPAVQVAWEDAAACCAWAGKRLPTQVEWEKAARGIDGRRFPWGDVSPDEGGVFRANYDASPLERDRFVRTAPAATFPAGASPYGVLDLAGNAFELTADDFSPDPPIEGGPWHYMRGGSWINSGTSLRVTNRAWDAPHRRYSTVGFRGVIPRKR